MNNAPTNDITSISLQVQTIGQFVKLSKGQAALLKAMRNCVKENKSISWDLLVNIFYDNVSKIQNHYYQPTYQDIKECYAAQNSTWQYSVRPRIRQWFVSTIGILVIKNQLVVIPTIDINE